ncbi:MAG TPA: hypothetical protein VIZ65_10945 [Cellvibrionaceae bacterium]
MSLDFMFNQSLMDEFKKEINYPTLLAHSPAPAVINMDWPATLATVKDEQGAIWQGQFQQPTGADFGRGASLSAVFSSGKHKIKVDIVSMLALDWKGRLDNIVRALTVTNRPSVNAKLIPSAADLFFVPKDTPGTTFCTFMVANFYIDMYAIDESDVAPLAQAILKIMLAHRQQPATSEKKSFSLKPKQYDGKVQSEFTVAVSDVLPDWIMLQPSALPSAIEWTGAEHNQYTFKATASGVYTVNFIAVHARNLLLAVETVGINIK